MDTVHKYLPKIPPSFEVYNYDKVSGTSKTNSENTLNLLRTPFGL